MKNSLLRAFVAIVLFSSLAAGALAQDAATSSTAPKQHPCKTEHESVVANCKNGDPCSAACKAARKAMRQCRMANNLPVRQGGGKGGAMKTKCKTGSANVGGSTNAPASSPSPAPAK